MVKGCGRVNKVQILCTHVCTQKNDTCRNYSRSGRKEYRRMVEGVNSSMIHLIYCKNFYKRHSVSPFSTKIKNNIRITENVVGIYRFTLAFTI
jgi:hypothetical protein